MSLGKLIKEYREQAGFTQEGLSKKLGYKNPQFISNIERDANDLPNRHILKLVDLIKIPIEDVRKWKIKIYKSRLDRVLKL